MSEASSHSYLGNSLEIVPQRIYDELADCSTYSLILLSFKDIVLFPSETIPLRLSNVSYLNILKVREQSPSISQMNFGVLNLSSNRKLAEIGTIASIRLLGTSNNQISSLTNSSHETVPITAIGTKRFRLHASWYWEDIHIGTVTILPDIDGSIRLNKLLNLSPFPTWVSQFFH
jgi:Lon protease-like protein